MATEKELELAKTTEERDYYKKMYYFVLESNVEKDNTLLKLRKDALALARSIAKLDGYQKEAEEWISGGC